ncbi:serine/threonine-protein phosphatase 4 regulatory subunit 4-like [Daktulosphaira vitifoliae]|uniref:serine/threonine-protein phosphatase 4 regulatory subunit 4-like n=1 Tax=Daktulosphaira vitifoliae TaxID=58002 RepID=UPI0021AA7577|nr:serine/threonine-protein phosphatase 4 regulatory subunit 4-like [Daktulosphaira vitifoliae]
MQENESKDIVESHFKATEAVRNILKKQLLSADIFQQTFLSTILSALDNSSINNDTVTNTWLDTLLDFIEFLPSDYLQNEILPFAIERSEISKPESLRLISCRIFGSLATKLNKFVIKREIWPCILSLCQDESVLVRKTVCQELSKIIGFLKESADDRNECILLPAIVDLANNADFKIKVAMLEVMKDIIICFPREINITIVLPMIKKLINIDSNSDLSLVISVSKNIGIICQRMKEYIDLNDITWFVNKFKELLELDLSPVALPNINDNSVSERLCTNVLIRKLCANSLQDIIMLISSDKGSTTLLIYLLNYLVDLVTDEFIDIRVALASIVKKILILLNEKVVLISTVLMKMLTERNTQVLKIIVPNLSFIIMKMKYQEQVLKSLMLLEEYLSAQYNWRLYVEFLHQIMVLPVCYSSDLVFIVGKIMSDRLNTVRQKPVKEAIYSLLLTFLRYNLDSNQRILLRQHLIDKTATNSNFYNRIFYIFICQEAMSIFSSAYFKKYFLNSLLLLVDDQVSNVRYGLCEIMPSVVKMISSSESDRNLFNRLYGVVNKLKMDEDLSIQDHRITLESCCDSITYIIQGKKTMCTPSDEDILKCREESRLLLMKSSERIRLENNGIFLKCLIEEKLSHSEIEEENLILLNKDEKISRTKKIFMLESEFIKDTGVSMNKMIEHSSKIPTAVFQTVNDSQFNRLHKEKTSYLPVKNCRVVSSVSSFQNKASFNDQQVVIRERSVIKRSAYNNRSKRLSVPSMVTSNINLTKDTNGNLVKQILKRPQSCCVESNNSSKAGKKSEKSLSDETLDKTYKKQPLSRLPIRKSQGK